MYRPATIPHHFKEKFHNKRCCIDIRSGKVHAVKINTNNRTWHNTIDLNSASVAINPKTRRENRLLRAQKEPFHMLSFGCGADTKYWGRYVCKPRNKGATFELRYVDDGLLGDCLPPGTRNNSRSYLERQWDQAFDVAGIRNVYEPATMKFESSEYFPTGKEYTPDVWLPDEKKFIEIKGPPPTEEELEKCRQTSQLGFNIEMFHGAPDGFDCYAWKTDGKCTKTSHASYYRYLHPKTKRKRRRLHNIKSM
jgi:hypothetical protein